MSGLIDNPQLTFDDLPSMEIHKEEFGKDKSPPKTPKVIGKSKAEEWVKSLKEKQQVDSKVKGQITITGGASTSHRLTEFEVADEKEKLDLAESLGEKAFKAGINAAAHDKELLKMIEGSKVGDAKPYLEAWNKGWTKANLHNTEPVHTEPKKEKEKEAWQMTEQDWGEYSKSKEIEAIEKWNKSGSKGFPPTTKPDMIRMIKAAEEAGYTPEEYYDKKTSKFKITYHQALVAKALKEGKSVPSEVLRDYPDLAELYPVNKTWKMNKSEARNFLTSINMDLHRRAIKEALEVGLKPYEGWEKDYPELVTSRPAHTEPKIETKKKSESEVDVLVEKIMERVRASQTVKEAAGINQELNKLSFKYNIPQEQMEKVYALIQATIDRLYKERELKESQEKAAIKKEATPIDAIKKEEPKQAIEVTLLNKIKAAKTRDELRKLNEEEITAFLNSQPSVSGFRSETDPRMIVARAYSEKMRELEKTQPIPPEETARMHAWGYKELDAIKFYRDQEIKKYQRNIDYVKREKKDLEELTAKLEKDPENKTLRWNWRQARKTLETNLSRMPYWEKIIENYNSPEWLTKNKDHYHDQYIKEVKKAISTGKPVPSEVIAQYHEFRKAKDARERYEKGWKTSFANKSAAVVESTKETAGVKVKRQDGKPITKEQIEEIVSGLKDIQDVVGNIMPVMKAENITVAHTSGKYPFLSQAGGMYHPTEKSVTMGIAGTNATAHEIFHFVDDVAKTQIPQTEPKYDLKLIGEASARINSYYDVDRVLSLSPKKTKEEKETARLLRAHLGSYWRRQEEIFARLMEQYVAYKNQKSSTAYNSLRFYETTPGWWSHNDFMVLLPIIEIELKRKLDLAYKKIGMTSAPAPVPVPVPVHVASAPVKKSDVKQPWEMTQKEYVDMRTTQAGAFDFGFPQYHKSHVEEAIKQGLPVPENVLKEYPDLMGLKKNPRDLIGSPANPIMKQQLLRLWKELLGAEDLGDFETFMKEVSDLTYNEAKEKLIKTYGSPKGKEGDKAVKAEEQACDFALEQCNKGENEACKVACDECGFKDACDKVKPVHAGTTGATIADIDMTGLIEDKTGERTSRLRIASGALKGKTAFRCPECFRGLTLTDKGLVCGEHGLIPLTGSIQVGRHTLGNALDLRKIGKDKEVTKQAKETYAWFLEEAKEAGFKTVKEYYDSLNDKERDSYKEYARIGVGLEEMFSDSGSGKSGKSEKKQEQQPKSDYQVLNDWLDKSEKEIDTPEGVEKYKSDWQTFYKEIYARLPKEQQDDIFSRLTGMTQYIYDKKKEAEAKNMMETPPTEEVKEWAKKAHGIQDYKGIRSDRIGMLRYILYKGEIGNLRDRNDALSMALALGKDLGYGEPPGYGKSLERYYAEKIANETGKEVPIIMGSSTVQPQTQALPASQPAKDDAARYKELKDRFTSYQFGTDSPEMKELIELERKLGKHEISGEFVANAGLINKTLADRSHMGTSFDPEKRAKEEIEGFAQEVQSFYEELKRYAKTPAQKALLIEEMQKFQAGYAQKYNAKLASQGNTISTMITGGSNFPVRRAQKANAAFDKRIQELLDYKDRAEKAIIRKLKGEGIEEEGGEIAHLENKLKNSEKLQEMMVEANKVIRKNIAEDTKREELVKIGFSEDRARELLKDDFAGRKGFTYQLQNNNQEIRRLRDRIAQLQRKETTETREFAFTGGNIVDNQKDDRIQIFFDQKPPQDIINKLKSEGWHWTPSIGAWQRKRTEYALMSANRITGAQAETQFGKAEPKPEPKPEPAVEPKPEPVHTEPKSETITGTENWFDANVEKIQLWSESGTMMGLISKAEAIDLVKSGRYKIVNGVAVTQLPTVGHEKAIPLEEAEEKIKKALAEEKKEKKIEPKTTPTSVIKSLANQRAAEWFKAQVKNPYERYYLYHRVGDFQVSNTDMPGYTISHPERISTAWTVDQAAQWIFSVSLKLSILPLDAVPPVAIVHHTETQAPEAPEDAKKKIDVQAVFDKYTAGFNDASTRAITMVSDKALASQLREVVPELSEDEALKIAPEIKELANKKAPPLPKPESKHIETMEEYRERKAKIWSEIAREPIRDIKVEIQVNRDKGKGREYPHVYVIKTAVTDKGLVKLDETIYKGSSEIKFVQNKGVDGFRREELYRIGKPLNDNIDKRYFTEYSDLEPKPTSGTLETIPETKPAEKPAEKPKVHNVTAKTVTKPKRFFINFIDSGGNSTFEETEGKPVTLKGLEGYDFFIHKTTGGKGYSITEARSGASIVIGIKTQEAAKAEAEKALIGLKDSIETKIKESIKINGLSPRYTDVEIKKPEPEPEKSKGTELKPQIPLYYIDIDLPTGLVRLFGILHNGRIFGEKSAFSLTGVYDLKGWQPLSEHDYNVYMQSIGGSGKQAARGKTIQWLEKNSDTVIKTGEEELAKQEKSEQLRKEVQEAIKKAEKEHILNASSLHVGDTLEWAVDKSRWVITEIKNGTVFARPESEPDRAGGSLAGDAKEGLVWGYKLVAQKQEEYKRPEYTLEKWTALYAPHLKSWSWNYYVKDFTSWWQKEFKSFEEIRDFLKKGESVLWVHGVRGDEKVTWTPFTLTLPKLLKEEGKNRIKGDTVYSLTQPYFASESNKWIWRVNKQDVKTGEYTHWDVDESELLDAKPYSEAEGIETRVERELGKYRMDDYSKAEVGVLWFVPDLVRDLLKEIEKLPKEKSDKYRAILEDMRTRAITERDKREKAEKEAKEKPKAETAKFTVKVYEMVGVPSPTRKLRHTHQGLIKDEVKKIVESDPNYEYDIIDSQGSNIAFVKLFGKMPEYKLKKIKSDEKPLEPARTEPKKEKTSLEDMVKEYKEICNKMQKKGITRVGRPEADVLMTRQNQLWEGIRDIYLERLDKIPSSKQIKPGGLGVLALAGEATTKAVQESPSKVNLEEMVSEWLKESEKKSKQLTARKEAEKILRTDLDKYDAYEWGTRVKLIEKHPAKGQIPDVLATGHLSDEDYARIKPFIKGVQQPRRPLKPAAQFVEKPDKFFIGAFDIDKDEHSFEEVEGKPVTIKGFENRDLFIHRTHGAAGYSITEGRSGTSVVRGMKTEKEARLEAEKVLNKFKGTLDKKIAEAVRVAGLSPRYTAIELKRSVEKLVEKLSEKPEPKIEKAVEKAVEIVKPELKPEPKPEPKPEIRIEPIHAEPKKPARAKKPVKKFVEKFIKTEYGRAIVKKAKAGVIELTSDDLKADVIILRG